MARILVTGGAGFIGSHLVDHLIDRRYTVAVVDNLSSGKRQYVNPRADFFQADIRSTEAANVVRRVNPEVVFHLAAQKSVSESVRHPSADADVNITGHLKLLEATRETQAKKFIFASSGGVMYGDDVPIPTDESQFEKPNSPYGLAKLTSERYLDLWSRLFGLQTISLRLANVYGPRQDPFGEAGVVAIFCQRVISGETILINGDGQQTRDFVYVSDVVSAFTSVLEKPVTGCFNIGTGIERSVLDIANDIESMLKVSIQRLHRPPVKGEVRRSALAWAKAKSSFGWEPSNDFQIGLQLTYAWFKSNKV